ncbi:hypothetical protein LPW26_05105 [Rhodopseudomonas sp. HC1]|uniref:hypothetical protein n=1 Tax=Rhodopseudomonas infernalis TaxID=2897386 RepID=UPI001EE7EA72|nr:hypothetical protein [Rhodopseudomonas infernalis]MCG6204003.1 hypothetical protein [Rhodopseudomonas infernalis]
MLELGLLCVIALAAIYWATMWLVGRHEDVLYGSFVTPTPGPAGSEALPPELPRRPRVLRPESALDEFIEMPALAKRRSALPPPRPAPLQRKKLPADALPPPRNEVLASLLEIIKRDLGEATRR